MSPAWPAVSGPGFSSSRLVSIFLLVPAISFMPRHECSNWLASTRDRTVASHKRTLSCSAVLSTSLKMDGLRWSQRWTETCVEVGDKQWMYLVKARLDNG